MKTSLWSFFLSDGDKLLVAISSAITTLEVCGVLPPSAAAHAAAALAAIGAILHTIALPEAPPPSTAPTKP